MEWLQVLRVGNDQPWIWIQWLHTLACTCFEIVRRGYRCDVHAQRRAICTSGLNVCDMVDSKYGNCVRAELPCDAMGTGNFLRFHVE
jgi:hypothetical protein